VHIAHGQDDRTGGAAWPARTTTPSRAAIRRIAMPAEAMVMATALLSLTAVASVATKGPVGLDPKRPVILDGLQTSYCERNSWLTSASARPWLTAGSLLAIACLARRRPTISTSCRLGR
jgi:hypothetical protein